MRDTILAYFESVLPPEIKTLLEDRLPDLEHGRFTTILTLPLARILLGHEQEDATGKCDFEDFPDWNDFIFHRVGLLLANRDVNDRAVGDSFANRQHLLFLIAFAALQSFVQSNVSGPPLPLASSELIFPIKLSSDSSRVKNIRSNLVSYLGIDGIAAYKLIPNVELLCLAETILINPAVKKYVKSTPWLQLRIDFLHQRLLSEPSSTLQSSIYESIAAVDSLVGDGSSEFATRDILAQWHLEKAAIETHHGLEKKARLNIDSATKLRNFEFVLTGRLGKKTKYQEKDISQLVVLAKSADNSSLPQSQSADIRKPKTLDLNDDTLLESISFSEPSPKTDPVAETEIPETLLALEPGKQPQLHPIDAIILLAIASAAANTSPADDLIREQTLPYALRVLEGGSSNWQVYTQALLVRSRIEGYRSRTVERGLLQLQTLVDQVIAEIMSLPSQAEKPEHHSAPVQERLQYVYQLCSPTRWELEAELAARWVSLGGLHSALEIYERLEMWPEAALCWAAIDHDDKARRMIRRLLYHATTGSDEPADPDAEKWEGRPRDPQPEDAPRLYCILGDLDNDTAMYERAWIVSNRRYARAQRSLGRHYYAQRDFAKSAAAYAQAVSVNGSNHATWFAYGCALLELADFSTAVDAFSRTVQLDDSDAEAWSNLAAALLRRGPPVPSPSPNTQSDATTHTDTNTNTDTDTDTDTDVDPLSPTTNTTTTTTTHPQPPDPQSATRDALTALKHAARLKHDSHRIWENLQTVAAALTPPAYADIVAAQARRVALRGAADGEACVDGASVARVLQHVVATCVPPAAAAAAMDGDEDVNGATDGAAGEDAHALQRPAAPLRRHGLAEQLGALLQAVAGIVTRSAALYRLLETHAEWAGRPLRALQFAEKGWRAATVATAAAGWEAGADRAVWAAVVEATVGLMDAYERLGPRERREGLAAGTGELVARDWRFKARMAGKGILGRGKGAWEGSEEWEVLRARVEALGGR